MGLKVTLMLSRASFRSCLHVRKILLGEAAALKVCKKVDLVCYQKKVLEKDGEN